jgi:hypothetical protein
MACEFGAPTVTLPKLTLAGVNTSVGCVPVPFSEIVVTAFGALLFIVTDPVIAPAMEGVIDAVNVLVWPAANVSGVVSPLIPKPAPETLACEIVTLAVPPFVSAIVCEPLLPTEIFPNATVPGFAVNWPCTPVPVAAIVVNEVGALLVIAMLPVEPPAAFGVKFAANEDDCPAAIEIGNVNPETV